MTMELKLIRLGNRTIADECLWFRPVGASRFLHAVCLSVLCLGIVGSEGCSQSRPPAPPRVQIVQNERSVIAEGQIQPAGGILRLRTAPSDVVKSMHVNVGDTVKSGDVLAILQSSELIEARRKAIQAQRKQAANEQQIAITKANQQLRAVDVKLRQIESQRRALDAKRELLAQGASQVAAARRILKRLESIAADPQTHEFVSEMEVEQQRIRTAQADIDFQQQSQTLQQSAESLEWSHEIALEEKKAAEFALETATSSEPLAAFDAQLSALDVEASMSTLKAPADGKVVAVNAGVGETSPQFPLIEMADTSAMVVEVEINELDASQIATGQKVTIRSRALKEPLHGKVSRVNSLIGRPQLRPLDPLAPIDYRSMIAIVEIDEKDLPEASNWIQLQVQVEIGL